MNESLAVFQMKHTENIECFIVSSAVKNATLKHIDFLGCFIVSVFHPLRGRARRETARPLSLPLGGVA